MVRLVVEDNGCGIPKDLRKHVFEPFFTTKKDGKGTGIGLTVVKRMVEEHGGWIQVQSEEEKGTTFIMNFPRVDDSKYLFKEYLIHMPDDLSGLYLNKM